MRISFWQFSSSTSASELSSRPFSSFSSLAQLSCSLPVILVTILLSTCQFLYATLSSEFLSGQFTNRSILSFRSSSVRRISVTLPAIFTPFLVSMCRLYRMSRGLWWGSATQNDSSKIAQLFVRSTDLDWNFVSYKLEELTVTTRKTLHGNFRFIVTLPRPICWHTAGVSNCDIRNQQKLIVAGTSRNIQGFPPEFVGLANLEIIHTCFVIYFNMDDPVGDFKTWFRSLPMFSRTFMAGSFLIACCGSLRLISLGYFALDIYAVIFRLQIWRLLTCFIMLGPFSFNWIFNAYFAYFALSRVQTDLFTRNDYPDFMWLVSYLWLLLLSVGIVLDIYFLGNAFTFAMLYIWCKRRPFEVITFFFGIRVKSGYFPFVYLGFNVLLGASIFQYILGLGAGHLYIFVKDILKPQHRKDYLATPPFFANLVNKYLLGRQPVQPRPNNPAQPANNIFAGRGVQIG